LQSLRFNCLFVCEYRFFTSLRSCFSSLRIFQFLTLLFRCPSWVPCFFNPNQIISASYLRPAPAFPLCTEISRLYPSETFFLPFILSPPPVFFLPYARASFKSSIPPFLIYYPSAILQFSEVFILPPYRSFSALSGPLPCFVRSVCFSSLTSPFSFSGALPSLSRSARHPPHKHSSHVNNTLNNIFQVPQPSALTISLQVRFMLDECFFPSVTFDSSSSPRRPFSVPPRHSLRFP